MPKRTCFWRHQWGKWSEPFPAEKAYSRTIRLFSTEFDTAPDYFQRRICELCRKVQEVPV